MQAEGKRPANEIQMAQIDEERARDEVKIEADKNSPLNRWSSRHKLKLVPVPQLVHLLAIKFSEVTSLCNKKDELDSYLTDGCCQIQNGGLKTSREFKPGPVGATTMTMTIKVVQLR